MQEMEHSELTDSGISFASGRDAGEASGRQKSVCRPAAGGGGT